jgi:hypothetical protein
MNFPRGSNNQTPWANGGGVPAHLDEPFAFMHKEALFLFRMNVGVRLRTGWDDRHPYPHMCCPATPRSMEMFDGTLMRRREVLTFYFINMD